MSGPPRAISRIDASSRTVTSRCQMSMYTRSVVSVAAAKAGGSEREDRAGQRTEWACPAHLAEISLIGERWGSVVFYLNAIDVHTADANVKGAHRGWRDQERVGRRIGDDAVADDIDRFRAPASVDDLDQLIAIGIQIDAALLFEDPRIVPLWLKCESRVIAGHGAPPGSGDIDNSRIESERQIFFQADPQVRFSLRLFEMKKTPISEPSSAPVRISTGQSRGAARARIAVVDRSERWDDARPHLCDDRRLLRWCKGSVLLRTLGLGSDLEIWLAPVPPGRAGRVRYEAEPHAAFLALIGDHRLR